MKADRYLFDGSHPCALRKLPCDSKDDHVKKEDILAKTAENLEKMAALQDAFYADGREGLIYGESQDADALARCLLQVLTAPDGGTALGQAARARALHTHDAAANAAALLGIYQTILKGDAP